jgi:hypothetical protein
VPLTRWFLPASLLFLFSTPTQSQQTPSNDQQALQFLRGSLNALNPNVGVNDVTLSGTVRRIAGSDDDSGTAVFKALASGAARAHLTLFSGQRSEVHDLSGTEPAGTWSGPDRVSHAVAFHNLISEPVWFFPAFAIARSLSVSGYVITYVGHETHNGHAVEHVSVHQISPFQAPPVGVSFEHLTRVDFFLDSNILLPEAISFNMHPDNDAMLDIPVEVQFSDYRTVNGTQVPFHVQRFLNSGLILDFHADSATLNTGLSANDFSL